MRRVEAFLNHLERKTEPNAVLSDWSGTYHCKAPIHDYYKPSTSQEIKDIMIKYSEYGSYGNKLRIKGSGLSYNGLGLSSDGMIDLSNYNKIVSLNEIDNKFIVRVESGCTLNKLLKYLNENYNLTLQSYPVISSASIGGIMQTGSHGSDINIGPFDTTISQFKLITYNGKELILNSKLNKELFYYIRVGLGCFGVITEIDVECIHQYALCQYIDIIDYKHIHKVKNMVISSKYVHPKLIWIPYTNKCVLVRYKKVTMDEYEKNYKKYTQIEIEERCQESMRKIYCDMIEMELNDFNKIYKDKLMSFMELKELILGFKNGEYMFNIEYIKKINESELKYWQIMEKYYNKAVYNLSEDILIWRICTKHIHYESAFDIKYIIELPMNFMSMIEHNNIASVGGIDQRFCMNSNSMLSPIYCHENKIFCYLGIFYYLPSKVSEIQKKIIYDRFVNEYCSLLNRLLLKYKAGHIGLHWPKIQINHHNKKLIQQILYQKYGDKIDTFLKLQKQIDPKSIFMNEFVTDILPTSPSFSITFSQTTQCMSGVLREASDSLLPVNYHNETVTLTVNECVSFDDENQQLTTKITEENNGIQDKPQWIIFGDDEVKCHSFLKSQTLEEQYEEFIIDLRRMANNKKEFDIYQILAYRSKININDNTYLKPFKSLEGLISSRWSELQIRFLNSYHRVLCQAIICFIIQTIGITTILITAFHSYFKSQRAACDYHLERWRTDIHLKLLAFLWTGFISLGVSGWIYKARHSGFYAILIFMKNPKITYPSFVNITILQLGLLTNYYVIASSVFGSYILIYQTEGGTETVNMILQAVALFFVLELDYTIVHKRDFLSIYKYFDRYIEENKHKQLPSGSIKRDNVFEKPCCDNNACCYGQSCLQNTLDVISFLLLIIMVFCAVSAPFLIMICW